MIGKSTLYRMNLLFLPLIFVLIHTPIANARINITTPKTSYVLGEPIFVNAIFVSPKDAFIFRTLEHNLSCVITDMDGNTKKARGLRGFIEKRLSDKDFSIVTVGQAYYSKKNITHDFFPDMGVGHFKIKFVFDKLTEPTPKNIEEKIIGYQESNEIEVIIKEPVGQDLDAFGILKKYSNIDKLNQLLNNVLTSDLRSELIRNYPDSVYAPYALYYQGVYDYRIGIRAKNEEHLKKAIQYYKDLLSSYRDFELIPEARLGIVNSYLALKQYDTVQQEAQKIIREFPNTFAAQESKELLNRIDAINE